MQNRTSDDDPRREIQQQIEDPLAERMLQATFQAGDTIVVDATSDGLIIDKKTPQREPVKAR